MPPPQRTTSVARSSSSSRRRAPSPPQRVVVAATSPPAAAAPPVTKPQSLGSVAAEGFAFGAGSATAHAVVGGVWRALTGDGSSKPSTTGGGGAATAAATVPPVRECGDGTRRAYTSCLEWDTPRRCVEHNAAWAPCVAPGEIEDSAE